MIGWIIAGVIVVILILLFVWWLLADEEGSGYQTIGQDESALKRAKAKIICCLFGGK